MVELECYNVDILEDDFIKIFKPIHLSQIVVGTIRMNLKDKFVSECTKIQKAYSMILIIFVTSVSIYQLIFDNSEYKIARRQKYFYLESVYIAFTTLMYVIVVINNKYFNCTKNAKLYVSLQKINRILKLRIKEQSNRSNYKFNKFGCIILIMTYILISLNSLFSLNLFMYLWFIAQIIVGAGGDLEMLNLYSILNYLNVRIKCINDMVNDLNSERNKCACRKCSIHYVQSNNDYIQIDTYLLVKAFKEIIKTYCILKQNYRFYVSILKCY